MPSATAYLPDDKEQRAAADDEFKARLELYKRNLKYYEGDHKKPLIKSGNFDDNVILNLCRQAVDRMVAFLVPSFPYIRFAGEGDTTLENDVWAVWRENGGATLLQNMVIFGALTGQVYARVWMDDAKVIHITPLNPSQCITWWDADNQDEPLWYEIRWQAGRIQWRQDIVPDGKRWVIREFAYMGSKWELKDEIIWAHELSPVVDFEHYPNSREYYGENEFHAAPLNDAANYLASMVTRILRFNAYPKTIGVGLEADELQKSAVDGFYTIADKDARVENLEMQSDLASSMNMLNTLTNMFYSESRVVMVNATPETFRGMTNLGIRATFMPMIDKNEVLRRQYSYGIQQITRRVLMLKGENYDMVPTLEWGEALPMDQREVVTLVQQQMGMGLMSKKTAAGKLGLDYDTEVKNILEEELLDAITAGTDGQGAAF